MTVLGDIASEYARVRYVKGYGSEHDDRYVNNELAIASACYAMALSEVSTSIAGTSEQLQMYLELGHDFVLNQEPDQRKLARIKHATDADIA